MVPVADYSSRADNDGMNGAAKTKLITTADALIAEGTQLLGTKWEKDRLGSFTIANPTSYVDLEDASKWNAGCVNFIRLPTTDRKQLPPIHFPQVPVGFCSVESSGQPCHGFHCQFLSVAIMV
jgi:hypothetical protein